MDQIGAIGAVSPGKPLAPEQERIVEKLAARDRDVRAHEAAHLAVAGALANGVQYTYELGPDGKLYAIAGDVKITVPGGLSPEQELADARQLRAAAEAPSDPSGQDMTVASQANEMEAEALAEIAKQKAPPAGGEAGHPNAHFQGLDRTA